ncbi:MAG: hypothetical protein RRC34_05490, partial [Lentisphaeria bacterium]|nr:hypothetical protein [Lentisphaeria bacterium]
TKIARAKNRFKNFVCKCIGDVRSGALHISISSRIRSVLERLKMKVYVPHVLRVMKNTPHLPDQA